jgi:hypothetical protein
MRKTLSTLWDATQKANVENSYRSHPKIPANKKKAPQDTSHFFLRLFVFQAFSNFSTPIMRR